MRELFDHIKWITEKQTKDYWDTLNDTERKRWSNYMINRFLSMKMDWISFVNEVQQYNLKPRDLYRLYIDMLPKGKQWLSVNQIDCESTKNLCWKLYEECIENWRMINAR